MVCVSHTTLLNVIQDSFAVEGSACLTWQMSESFGQTLTYIVSSALLQDVLGNAMQGSPRA